MKHWRDRAIREISQVGIASGITAEEMLGRIKHPHIVKARHNAMLAVREKLGLSYTVIGELFDRDHSTVIYGCRVARTMRGDL